MIPLPHKPRELIEFKSSEPLTEAWRTIVNDPVTQKWMTAMRLAANPMYTPAPVPGLHPDTVTAHHWHLCQGMLLVLDQMQKCTLHPSDPIHLEGDEQPFDHLIPENLRKSR